MRVCVERCSATVVRVPRPIVLVHLRLSVSIIMSNQYAHLYQHQQPSVHDPEYPAAVDSYHPHPLPPSPFTSYSGYPHQSLPYIHPYNQLQHAQNQPHFPPPVSPAPSHHLVQSPQAAYPLQAIPNGHPISAPSPQYPQQLPTLPHVGYTSPPTSPVSNAVSRRPLPTPGAPPSQLNSSAFRHPLPTPGPTPAPTSPHSRSHPLHPPGPLTGASIPISSQQPMSPSLASTSPTSPTGTRRPLPLPRTIPGHSFENGPRSSSPVKDAIKAFSAVAAAAAAASVSPPADPSPLSPTKFVPYWKRTLPDPSTERVPSASSSLEAMSSSSASGSSGSAALAETGQQRDRSKSIVGGRPLPPSPLDGSVGKPPFIPPAVGSSGERSRALPNPSSSPVRPSTRPPSPVKLASSSASSLPSAAGSSTLFSPRPVSPTKNTLPSRPISPASSDGDGNPSPKGMTHQNDRGTPSPQYGIRDLPGRSQTVINRNNARHTRAAASIDRDDEPVRGRSNRSSTLPQPPAQGVPTQSNHRATQSVSMRSPVVIPPSPGSSRPHASTPTSPTGWPSTLPPLPRAPKAGAGEASAGPHTRPPRRERREYVNLDDAPPPSLRRSPSPSVASTRRAPQGKSRSYVPSAQKGTMRDTPAPPRRGAASVPSSPEKTSVSLPQVPGAPTHQGSRSRSVTPAHARQPASERSHGQQQPQQPLPPPPQASRPPPSAFSQRFVAGKPAPAEPQVTTTRMAAPHISVPGATDGDPFDESGSASFFVSEPELPQITFSDPTASALDMDDGDASPTDDMRRDRGHPGATPTLAAGGGRIFPPASSARRGGGLACGGCGGPIVGRIVSAMGVRWHPGCFRCSDCDDLLEYVSSYERDGKPYCHFDYHERFAPRCYHCKTAIVDERFITLDDPELGKRTYHEQHFFCSECGDPFLAPSIDRQNAQGVGGITFKGDGEFENDDVGFTVYKGYPYCEACHVRLRSPKCKKCKNIIRDGMQAVEALGGKYHWECFSCTGCDKPFEDPSFFLRDNKPFCERCYSIILKSEM
ncbi:hypothetical protein BC834DRAFT_459805 [Gloeopeniophorella convolvens]|nr:hypothetical protein BC834DRAFT_459805 [Gloeopeniophorella convolvens]